MELSNPSLCIEQNQWIRANLIDCYGNYAYCIRAYINMGPQRLHNQRITVQKLCVVVAMSKSDVRQQKLEQHVLLPTDTTTFKDWCATLDEDDDVDVKYPHEQHGLTGRTSIEQKLKL